MSEYLDDGARENADKVIRLRVAEAKDANAPAPIIASPFQWLDPAMIPRREWLYGRHLIRRFVSATIAPGGLGKSSLVLVEALAMVTARPLLAESPSGRLRVWYWSGEDPNEETQRRLIAACKYYRIRAEDLAGYLFVDSGREQPIQIAADEGAGFVMNDAVIDQIERQIIANSIDVVIIDPFVNSHGVSENDNGRINAVVRAWARIADHTGCAVELVHHVRKPGAGAQGETSVDDARGATALIGAVRSARVLNAMTENEAVTASVENRLLYFRVDNGKANLAPRSSDAKWRHLVSIDLGNGDREHDGDSIGVVTAWEMPGIFAGVTSRQVEALQRTVAAGKWRADVQSTQWIGRAVATALALDLDDNPAVRPRIKRMLADWIKNGVFKLVDGVDDKRNARQFVEVGKWLERPEDF